MIKGKKKVKLNLCHRLINHGATVLVTSNYREKSNVLAIAWQSPLSYNPPLFGICVNKGHWSKELIEKGKEFTINIPSKKIIDRVHYCGSISGKNVSDKFKQAGLKKTKGIFVKSPIIKECFGHIECKVKDKFAIGDHILFVGRPLLCLVDDELFNKYLNIEEIKTLHHLGGNRYTYPARVIAAEKVKGAGRIF